MFGMHKRKQQPVAKTSTAQAFQADSKAIDFDAKVAEFESWDVAEHLTLEDPDPSVFEIEWEGFAGLYLGATVRGRAEKCTHIFQYNHRETIV